MRTGLIPITFAVACACGGASDEEVREAQTSGYRGDFALIYSETLAAVRDLYPQLGEDVRTGVIRTAWHPVNVQTANEEPGQDTRSPGQPRSSLATSSVMREQLFIRFDVHVVGGRPWRVRVHGEASSWKAGDAIPTPLRGPEVPHWLEGRTNALEVAIHRRLKKYAVQVKFQPHSEIAEPGPAPSGAHQPVDVARFGKLPAGAARVIASAAAAARSRDIAGLRTLMADQFTYSIGDAPSASTAIILWQADPSLLAELAKALDAGCAPDPARTRVVCPAAALADAGFSGYRAGFQDGGKGWRMVFFVTGD